MAMPVILLVEDSASDEALSLQALRKSHVANEVVVARDGTAALDYLFARNAWKGRDPRDLPQLVLLDLNLPKTSGLEVLRAIRNDARTRMLPVVILTSSREDGDIYEGYGLGANSYIVKPIDTAQFTEAARALGLYWVVLGQANGRDGTAVTPA
jgi:two-component system, response regulator